MIKLQIIHTQLGMQVNQWSASNGWIHLCLFGYGDTLDTRRTEAEFIRSLDQEHTKYELFRENQYPVNNEIHHHSI